MGTGSLIGCGFRSGRPPVFCIFYKDIVRYVVSRWFRGQLSPCKCEAVGSNHSLSSEVIWDESPDLYLVSCDPVDIGFCLFCRGLLIVIKKAVPAFALFSSFEALGMVEPASHGNLSKNLRR